MARKEILYIFAGIALGAGSVLGWQQYTKSKSKDFRTNSYGFEIITKQELDFLLEADQEQFRTQQLYQVLRKHVELSAQNSGKDISDAVARFERRTDTNFDGYLTKEELQVVQGEIAKELEDMADSEGENNSSDQRKESPINRVVKQVLRGGNCSLQWRYGR